MQFCPAVKPASRQGVPEATAFDYFKRLTDLNECRDASSKLKALTKKASPKLSTKQQSGISLPFQVSTGPSQAEETSSQNNDGLTSTISSMCSNLEDSKCLQESSDVSTTSTDDELEETSDDETMTNLVTLSDYFEELEDSDELEETSDDETMTNLVTLSDYFEELEDSDELEETSDDETTTNLATLSVSSEEFEDKYASKCKNASETIWSNLSMYIVLQTRPLLVELGATNVLTNKFFQGYWGRGWHSRSGTVVTDRKKKGKKESKMPIMY